MKNGHVMLCMFISTLMVPVVAYPSVNKLFLLPLACPLISHRINIVQQQQQKIITTDFSQDFWKYAKVKSINPSTFLLHRTYSNFQPIFLLSTYSIIFISFLKHCVKWIDYFWYFGNYDLVDVSKFCFACLQPNADPETIAMK